MLNFQKLMRFLWERACPANTGEAGAMLRAACFAGQARSHSYPTDLKDSAEPVGSTALLNFQKLMQLMWERACPTNTGEAGAILRAACFAGQARSHRYLTDLKDNAEPVGATALLNFQKLMRFLWERACPANTGEAGAMLRVAGVRGSSPLPQVPPLISRTVLNLWDF